MWPGEDTHLIQAIWAEHQHYQRAVDECERHNVVVQAGGATGVWPQWLASRFKTVVTFEPDPTNFHCLANNVTESNVIKIQAALSDYSGWTHLVSKYHPDEVEDGCISTEDAGAHQIRENGGIVVVGLALDDLALSDVDLIILDVEGSEPAAIKGAMDTIMKFDPLLLVEANNVAGNVEEMKNLVGSLDYYQVWQGRKDILYRR